MNTLVEPLEVFMTQLDWSQFCGFRYDFAAWRRDENTIFNLACRLVAVPAQAVPEKVDEERLQAGELIVGGGWLSCEEFEQLLLVVRSTRIELGGVTLALQGNAQLGYLWQPISTELAKKMIHWPALAIQGTGQQQSVLGGAGFDPLRKRLLGLTRGRFDSYEAIGRHLGGQGAPMEIGGRSSSVLEILVPHYLRLVRADVNAEERQLTVTAESAVAELPDDLGLWAVPADGGNTIPIQMDGWQPGTDRVRSFTADLPQGCGPVTVQLFAFGETIDSRVAGLPNLADLAHEQFDPNDAWLSRLLGPEGTPTGDAFAHYVLTLLHLAGIPAISYGHGTKGLRDAPDLIAELDPQTLLVGECKSDAPTPDEVGTLASRATAIVSKMGRRWTINCYCLLFTSVSGTHLSAPTLSAAHQQSVTIVARERLLAFRDGVRRGYSVGHLLALLLRG